MLWKQGNLSSNLPYKIWAQPHVSVTPALGAGGRDKQVGPGSLLASSPHSTASIRFSERHCLKKYRATSRHPALTDKHTHTNRKQKIHTVFTQSCFITRLSHFLECLLKLLIEYLLLRQFHTCTQCVLITSTTSSPLHPSQGTPQPVRFIAMFLLFITH